MAVGFYAENRNHALMPVGRWLGWAGYTVLLVVFIIRDHRKSLRHVSFWTVLVGLLVAHTAIYVVAFQFVNVWRGIWFLPVSIAEYLVFSLTLHWLGYDDTHRRRGAEKR